MKQRKLTEDVLILASVDWDRRLFDALIPLPDGTSYNSYLVKGSQKTALIDSTDPKMLDTLLKSLKAIERIDYVVSNHAEQDHSGAIPDVLKKYPDAKLVCTPKAKPMLMDLLAIPEERFLTVEDNSTLSLGSKTLKFLHMPWVHWPETMVTYIPEDKILFSCDLFGSHLAASGIFVKDEAQVYESAKRYYAEIMMPFRSMIKVHLERLEKLELKIIAPSHGPVYDKPGFILSAYRDWISDTPKNSVVIPYISMHGSTKLLVEQLVAELAARNIEVHQFDLSATDIGKLAVSLVDAATVVIATPTIHAGPHPSALYAAILANALRPKARFAALIGSYGWSEKQTIEKLAATIPNLKVELLGTVFCKGLPRQKDLDAITGLADTIVKKHKELNLS